MMKDVKRIDYFSYEELTILGGSKLPPRKFLNCLIHQILKKLKLL